MGDRRRDVDELRGEIEELFADLWQVPRFSGIRHGFRPQCDCFRTDDPPALPLKGTVVFPESVTPLAIGQERSIRLIGDVVGGDRLLALVTVLAEDAETPGWDDLYETGSAAVVHKMIRVPYVTLRILVQG